MELRIFGEPSWLVPKHIRKLVPPKVVLFFWQLLDNKIAVKESLIRRGIIIENGGICEICGVEGESEAHLMLRCQVSWRLWCAILVREDTFWCAPSSLKDLMLEWPSLRVKTDPVLWEIIPYALCWSIWRNDVVFNQKELLLEAVWDIHIMRVMWWVKAWWRECPFSSLDFTRHFEKVWIKSIASKVRVVDWFPPPHGVLKFNVDGSSRGNPGVSGAGGVLRNSTGATLGFFSLPLGITWAYIAEVKAILNALLFCKNNSVSQFVVESDSSLAVGWVVNKANRPWKLLFDLNQIDLLMVEVGCVEISHIFREANVEADKLAKSGCDRSSPLAEFILGGGNSG